MRPRMPGRSSAAFCSAGTSSSTRRPRSSSPPPSRPRSRPARHPGRRAGVGVFPRPVVSRCSDNGSLPGPGRPWLITPYLPIWSSRFSGPVRAVNAGDQRPATSSAHHGPDWPGSRHLQDCDGVPPGSRPNWYREASPGMAQEILSRQSLRLLGGSRSLDSLCRGTLTRRMAGAGPSGQPDPFGCVLLA
jgi:hypothetical protein